LQSQIQNCNAVGLFKFFRVRLVHTPDDKIDELAKEYENSVKSLKRNIYKLGWYMRGGVDVHKLFSDTDLEDLEILNKVIEENIETSKQTKMPLI